MFVGISLVDVASSCMSCKAEMRMRSRIRHLNCSFRYTPMMLLVKHMFSLLITYSLYDANAFVPPAYRPPLHVLVQEQPSAFRSERVLRQPLLHPTSATTSTSSRKLDASLVVVCMAARRDNMNRRSNDDDNANSIEAIQSLVEFHQGTWKGIAKSFAVTQDVAAGIVQRYTSPSYMVTTKLGLSSRNEDDNDEEYELTETYEYDNLVSIRQLLLSDSSMDVDSVDASYSLDTTISNIPSFISGSDQIKQQFLIEHCIATSDKTRSRCMAIYGVDLSLLRVVTLYEEKIDPDATKSVLSADDMIFVPRSNTNKNTINNGGTKDAILESILQSTTAGSSSSGGSLAPHPVSLLELSSGIWLGDAIIRDIPVVPTSAEVDSGRGFDPTIARSSSSSLVPEEDRVPFGDWSIGVQKVAFRWMWNFEDEIRIVNNLGKAMGATMIESLSGDLPGLVCVNEGLSRRIPKDERMVYIDWKEDNVGFLVGSYSIQLPRFWVFDRSGRRRRPLYTEFGVYQAVVKSDESQIDESSPLPTLVCSKISRTYNYKGKLKQAISFFYELKRFGVDDTNE